MGETEKSKNACPLSRPSPYYQGKIYSTSRVHLCAPFGAIIFVLCRRLNRSLAPDSELTGSNDGVRRNATDYARANNIKRSRASEQCGNIEVAQSAIAEMATSGATTTNTLVVRDAHCERVIRRGIRLTARRMIDTAHSAVARVISEGIVCFDGTFINSNQVDYVVTRTQQNA